jgi:hypothetical protein
VGWRRAGCGIVDSAVAGAGAGRGASRAGVALFCACQVSLMRTSWRRRLLTGLLVFAGRLTMYILLSGGGRAMAGNLMTRGPRTRRHGLMGEW